MDLLANFLLLDFEQTVRFITVVSILILKNIQDNNTEKHREQQDFRSEKQETNGIAFTHLELNDNIVDIVTTIQDNV